MVWASGENGGVPHDLKGVEGGNHLECGYEVDQGLAGYTV